MVKHLLSAVLAIWIIQNPEPHGFFSNGFPSKSACEAALHLSDTQSRKRPKNEEPEERFREESRCVEQGNYSFWCFQPVVEKHVDPSHCYWSKKKCSNELREYLVPELRALMKSKSPDIDADNWKCVEQRPSPPKFSGK